MRAPSRWFFLLGLVYTSGGSEPLDSPLGGRRRVRTQGGNTMLEEIPNYPQMFMDRHMNWHMMTPPDGRAIPQGQPGSGAEFLDFHHQFIIDVKNWYATQPAADLSKLDAWTQFPNDLANAHSPELANFAAYAGNAANFTSEDALGIYVESEHNLVHGYVADFYNTPAFGGFDSCMFFVFYQWHGLIDAWRGNWLVHNKRAIKDLLDNGGAKHIVDKVHSVDKFHKEVIQDINVKQLRDAVVKQVPEVPSKSPKEVVELPGSIDQGDPLTQLSRQLAQLENIVHRQAFIRPQERPEVG